MFFVDIAAVIITKLVSLVWLFSGSVKIRRLTFYTQNTIICVPFQRGKMKFKLNCILYD